MEIKPQYKHTKVGQFLFDLTAKMTMFIVRHQWFYYVLSFTWGILMTLISLLVTVVLFLPSLFTKKIKFGKWGWVYYIQLGKYWGGFETGIMFLRDEESDEAYINNHEFGHTMQNILFGPLDPFISTIPSVIHYWLSEIFPKYGEKPYAALWFEDSADQCGKWAHDYIKAKKQYIKESKELRKQNKR